MSRRLFALRNQICRNIMKGFKKPEVVHVLGRPGSGKGTMCEKIAEDFGYVHLSGGQMLRDEREKESEWGKIIDEHFSKSMIIPANITSTLLIEAMHRSDEKQFLLDGFPPDPSNFEYWNSHMSNEVKIQFVLFLDCSDEICIKRCLSRRRSDDIADTLEKRLRIFREDTMQIVNNYQDYQDSNLVRRVDASKPVNEVLEEVKMHFQQYRDQQA